MGALNRVFQGQSPAVVAATLALGGAGGLLARWLGLPLPMLLGGMVSVVGAAALGMRVRGLPLTVPQRWRHVLVPVIGVAIGANVTEAVVEQARFWWITVLALLAFVPAAHALSYVVFRRIGGLSRPTAYFAAMPGGFIEALEMGEKGGADMPMLIMLQFLRLILCIVTIPVIFSVIEGHAVGSAAGATAGAHPPLTAWDAGLMLVLAVTGWAFAHRLRFPAAVLSGPLLFSAVAHGVGLTQAVPPFWAILVTQWVMGTALGVRLIGFRKAQFGQALGLSVLSVGTLLMAALAIAWLLAESVAEPVAAVMLAFAPGGVSEMSLVALSLHLSAVYVSLHHMLRIVLAVLVARAGLSLLERFGDRA